MDLQECFQSLQGDDHSMENIVKHLQLDLNLLCSPFGHFLFLSLTFEITNYMSSGLTGLGKSGSLGESGEFSVGTSFPGGEEGAGSSLLLTP